MNINSIIWDATENKFDASLTEVIPVVDWDVGFDWGVGFDWEVGLGVGPKVASNHKNEE